MATSNSTSANSCSTGSTSAILKRKKLGYTLFFSVATLISTWSRPLTWELWTVNTELFHLLCTLKWCFFTFYFYTNIYKICVSDWFRKIFLCGSGAVVLWLIGFDFSLVTVEMRVGLGLELEICGLELGLRLVTYGLGLDDFRISGLGLATCGTWLNLCKTDQVFIFVFCFQSCDIKIMLSSTFVCKLVVLIVLLLFVEEQY